MQLVTLFYDTMTKRTPDPSTLRPGERLVVTEGGTRVSGQVHATAESAAAEANAKRRRLQETGGDAAKVKVVQTLNG